MAALAAKKPLNEVLHCGLGDRFDSSQISQASLDALTESREHDKPWLDVRAPCSH
jgi:hypothetical protein